MSWGVDHHPPPDELVADPMDAAVLAHLRGCAACRIEQRRVRRWIEEKAPTENPQTELPSDLSARIDRDLAVVLRAADSGPLSRYAIDDRQWIGNGDHGVVYEVYDREQQRRVVLKVLHDVDVEHLRRVAVAVEAVGHPNLVRYYDIVDADPLHVSRPLVDGATFDEALERATRPKALRLLGLVCSALGALHRMGLPHGGISAANIRVDPRGRAHVLDAGLTGPGALPRDDWRALAHLVQAHAPQLLDDPGAPAFSVSGMLRRMVDPDPERCPEGIELLAALALETGLGGLDATRYQIRSVLSEGGMGVLCRAWDPVLRREVALKRIKAGPADSLDAMRRFLNEARIAAQLQHPNIVPVHELDWGPDARPFLTMKLIDGRHFGELVDEMHRGGPTRLRDVVEVVARLCDAVAYAHGKGVLHLDLKPRNVLVGAYGDVQLIDWGAARVVGRHVDLDERDRSDRQELTRPYSPPEQQDSARTGELEPRSDVYALGAVLVNVLTGARPPETRPMPRVRTLAPNADRELSSIVDRATSDRIADRYADATALGRDLRAWLSHERVSAHDYGPVQLLDLWSRGRRGWIGLVLVSTLAVGTVGWFAVLGWRTSAVNDERQREQKGTALAEQARYALVAGDRIDAERKAAEAVDLAHTPEGRGVLMSVGRAWYPRDAGRCVSSDGVITCSTDRRTVVWHPAVVKRWGCGPLDLGSYPATCDGQWNTYYADVIGDEAGLWRTGRTGPMEFTRLAGYGRSLVAVAWSPDLTLVATADDEGIIRLWAPQKPNEIHRADPTTTFANPNVNVDVIARLPGHGGIRAMSFDDPTLLLVDADPPRAWDLSGAGTADAIAAPMPQAELGWDAAAITTIDRQRTWRSWSPATGTYDGGGSVPNVVAAASSPDGRSVALVTPTLLSVYDRRPAVMSPASDGSTRVEPPVLVLRWSQTRREEDAVVWSDQHVIAGGSDGVIRWWDSLTHKSDDQTRIGMSIEALAVAGKRVLALGDNGVATLVKGSGSWPGVSAIAADLRNERFALGFRDGTIRVGADDVGQTDPVVSLGANVRALAFGPDGHTLAVAADDHTVRVFGEDPTWRELARTVLDQRSPPRLAFSPNGDSLAVAGGERFVELWDATVLRAKSLSTLVDERYGAAPSEVRP